MTPELRLTRLQPASFVPRVILDTDAFNEVDDQFFIAHSLLSPDRMRVEAIVAAPFVNERAATAKEGMEKSFDEILRLLEIMGRDVPAFRGAERTIGDQGAVDSAGVQAILEASRRGEEPLYVLATGAATNVASALLLDPGLVERTVVVWLGGHAWDWTDQREFNLQGDPAAARVLLDCGVPLINVPALGVSSHLLVSPDDLSRDIGGSRLGRYLAAIVADHHRDHFAYAKEIWDVAVSAWMVNPAWVPTIIVRSPWLTEDLRYEHPEDRHDVSVATWCARNAIFRDLFAKIGRD
ncbi:MAG: nucleoside hydrolase [Fimbriimonadaceae bacterium]|nr:nucleoside hydrolase [Fimbriimonadaceae bacterium]